LSAGAFPEAVSRSLTVRVVDVPLDARAIVVSSPAVLVVLIGVFPGSGGPRWLDAVLAGYLVGVLPALFATVYRYLILPQRRLP
jgi:hypothetical protein